jgi:hypothetical protein
MAESLGRAAKSREIRPWRLLGERRKLGEEKTENSAEGATRDWGELQAGVQGGASARDGARNQARPCNWRRARKERNRGSRLGAWPGRDSHGRAASQGEAGKELGDGAASPRLGTERCKNEISSVRKISRTAHGYQGRRKQLGCARFLSRARAAAKNLLGTAARVRQALDGRTGDKDHEHELGLGWSTVEQGTYVESSEEGRYFPFLIHFFEQKNLHVFIS